MRKTAELLAGSGIQPSAQRVAVAQYVLATEEHPTAERVLEEVQKRFPMISRATVYNCLNLFVGRGLIRSLVITPGTTVFDPNVGRHHHFVDEETGAIRDVEWARVEVGDVSSLQEFEIHDYQVVMRGVRRKNAGATRNSSTKRKKTGGTK